MAGAAEELNLLSTKLVQAWKQQRVLEAHRILETMRSATGSEAAVAAVVRAASMADPDRPANLIPAEVDSQAKQAIEALDGLEDLSGFRLVRDTEGLDVQYRYGGGSVHTARFESDMEYPPERILLLAREWDLVSSWNKFVMDTLVLHEVSEAEVWVYGGVWMPFPFSSRDVLMRCIGMDLLEEAGCYLITISSDAVDEDPKAAASVPAAAASRVRVDNLRGTCIKIVPLPPAAPGGDPRCRVSMMVHHDSHVPLVPQLMIDFGLHILSPFVHSQVRRLLAETCQQGVSAGRLGLQQRPQRREQLLGGRYSQRLEGRPGLYQRLRGRTESLLSGTLLQRSLDSRDGFEGAGAGGADVAGTNSGQEVHVTIDASMPTEEPIRVQGQSQHGLLQQREDDALDPHEEQQPVVLYDTTERSSAGTGGLRRGGGSRGTLLERTSPRKEGGRLLLRGSVGGDGLLVRDRGRKGGIGSRLWKLLWGSGADITRGRGLRGNGSTAVSRCCSCSAFRRMGWWRAAVLLSASALLLLLLCEMGQLGGALGI